MEDPGLFETANASSTSLLRTAAARGRQADHTAKDEIKKLLSFVIVGGVVLRAPSLPPRLHDLVASA